MVSRTAELIFAEKGARQGTAEVIKLSDALDRQRRSAQASAQQMDKAVAGTKQLESVSASATGRILAMTGALGPLAVGLGSIVTQAPRAAQTLLQAAAGAERLGVVSKLLNPLLLTGASVMAVGGVAAVAYADDLLKAADSYSALHAKIRTFTDSAFQTAQAERALYQSSMLNRASIDGEVKLYARLQPAVKDLGRTQLDAIRVTDLATKALTIQGVEAQEAWAATLQLGQAIGSGVLRGDEFRTLREAAPQLLRYVAANLDINGKVGVAYSQLKNLADKGELTSERVVNALLKAGPQIEKDFVNAPKTAQQEWQVLQDQIVRTIGQLAQSTGAQQAVVTWLANLAHGADEFRQKLLLDPHSLDPVKAAAGFIGDAVGSIGTLGSVAVHHFDAIVTAGQALIALKLGEVLAGAFAGATTAARTAIQNLAQFQAQARYQAGAALSPGAASAASALRGVAVAADGRAAELQAQADLKAAQAAAARGAADIAVANASTIKAVAGTRGAATAEAEAIASRLVDAANRAEAQAKALATQATNAKVAASTRNAIALEAERTVTDSVTASQVRQSVAQRAAVGLYNLLGGAVGIAALAIGGLIFALMKAEEAYQAQNKAQHDALVIGDQLRAITEQMTAATWAEIPALQAKAQALLQNAEAARQEAEQQLKLALARRQAYDAMTRAGGDQGGLAVAGLMNERGIRDVSANLAAARGEEFRRRMELTLQNQTVAAQEAARIRSQLDSGLDTHRNPLSAGQRSSLETRLAGITASANRQVDSLATAIEKQESAINQASGSQKSALQNGLTFFRRQYDAAGSIIAAAATTTKVNVPSPGAGKKTHVPGGVNQALTELEQQLFFPMSGGGRFSVSGGTVQDSSTGGVFTARSEDEARAAQKYLDQIKAINGATDAQIAKTGQSRDELRKAASAYLDHAVATSQASQAEERWADLQATAAGETRAVVKAERDVNELRERGAEITDAAAKAYIAYVAAQERAQKLKAALSFDSPFAKDAADLGLAGLVVRTDNKGLPDIVRAERDILQAKESIIAESEARIRAETAKQAELEGQTKEQTEKLLADRIAANRLAVETELQGRILDLERQRVDDAAKLNEERVTKLVDSVEGGLHDLIFGGSIKDIGAQIGNDFLQAIYDNLIRNPLRNAIRDAINSIMTGGGGGGNFFSQVFAFAGKLFGGGNGLDLTGPADVTSGLNTSIPSFTIPGFAKGVRDFSGGLARVHDGELMYLAPGTDVYNKGESSLIESSMRRSGSRAGGNQYFADFSINAPGADAAGLKRVEDQQQQMMRTWQSWAASEPNRWASNMNTYNRFARRN